MEEIEGIYIDIVTQLLWSSERTTLTGATADSALDVGTDRRPPGRPPSTTLSRVPRPLADTGHGVLSCVQSYNNMSIKGDMLHHQV